MELWKLVSKLMHLEDIETAFAMEQKEVQTSSYNLRMSLHIFHTSSSALDSISTLFTAQKESTVKINTKTR